MCKVERQNKDIFKQAKDGSICNLQACMMKNVRGSSSVCGQTTPDGNWDQQDESAVLETVNRSF